MTPTMSEYFDAWKNSRFVAGENATETAFVAASRLQDIADILGGLVLVYENVKPIVAKADKQQAAQTEQSLTQLHDFAADLLAREEDGREVHRRAGRHAGGAGAGPRRGHRGPDHPGRGQAQHRDRGGLTRRGALALILVAAALAGGGSRAGARRPGSRRRACRIWLFEAQTALLLDGGAEAPRLVAARPRRAARTARARPALATPLRPAAPRSAPWPRAQRAAADGDEVALAAARGRLRAALLRGSLRGDRGERCAPATPSARATGCCCASSARPPASPARAWTPPWPCARSAAAGSARARRCSRWRRTCSTPTRPRSSSA